MTIGQQQSKFGNTPEVMLNYLNQTVIFGTKQLGYTEGAEDKVLLAASEGGEAELES